MCNCCHGHFTEVDPKCAPLPSYNLCLLHENLNTTIEVLLHHVERKQAKQGPFHFQWLAHRLSPKEVLICHLIKKKCGDYRSFCGNL